MRTRATRSRSLIATGKMRAEFLATSWTWTPNSTWVNDLRVGWNHYLRNTADRRLPDALQRLRPQHRDYEPTIAGISRHQRRLVSRRSVAVPSRRETSARVTITMSWITFPGCMANTPLNSAAEILYLHTFFDQIPNGRGTFTFTGGKYTLVTFIRFPI